MKLYFASFYEPINHHGTVVSISLKKPFTKSITILPHPLTSLLAPPAELLADWKMWRAGEPIFPQVNHIEAYRDRYLQHYDTNRAKIHAQFESLAAQSNDVTDLTLCCYEKAGNFCHRYLVARELLDRFPKLYGGSDVHIELEEPLPPPRAIALAKTKFDVVPPVKKPKTDIQLNLFSQG